MFTELPEINFWLMLFNYFMAVAALGQIDFNSNWPDMARQRQEPSQSTCRKQASRNINISIKTQGLPEDSDNSLI